MLQDLLKHLGTDDLVNMVRTPAQTPGLKHLVSHPKDSSVILKAAAVILPTHVCTNRHRKLPNPSWPRCGPNKEASLLGGAP